MTDRNTPANDGRDSGETAGRLSGPATHPDGPLFAAGQAEAASATDAASLYPWEEPGEPGPSREYEAALAKRGVPYGGFKNPGTHVRPNAGPSREAGPGGRHKACNGTGEGSVTPIPRDAALARAWSVGCFRDARNVGGTRFAFRQPAPADRIPHTTNPHRSCRLGGAAPSPTVFPPRTGEGAPDPALLQSPETFDFLGFTHYCRTTRNGKFGLGRTGGQAGRPDPTAYRCRAASDAP